MDSTSNFETPEFEGISSTNFICAMFRITMPWPFAPIMVPIVDWLPKYNWKEDLPNDLTAGFTVFVFLIPQGMAYALLAGMPPVYGLYSAIVPLYFYAMLGTSRQLSLGPMAITSLLLNVTVQSLGYEEQTADYIQVVMNLSMVVGLTLFLLGLLRLGALVNLISESVLVGFLTASALVIFLNQVKYIFGIHVPRFPYTYQTIIYILSHLGEANGNACGLGLATLTVLLIVRWWKKNNKATPERLKDPTFRILDTLVKLSNLLCIVIGATIAYGLTVDGLSLDIVGAVPSGLKAPTFTSIGFQPSLALIPGGLALAFVAFAGNWAICKKYASEKGYTVDATQELIGHGFSVIIGALFNSFAGSGGLARSAVNAEAGAQTQISGVVAATLVLLAVQFLTSWFYYIPMAVLGAVIQVSVISMFDFEAMVKAYHTHRSDCVVMVSTFLFTFFVGVSEGLFVGIFISIGMIIHATAFPSIVHVGKLPEQEGGHYKRVDRFPNAVQHPGVAILRMDGTLFFANCAHFKDVALRAAQGEFHTSTEPIHKLIIDASCWMDIDLAGVNMLVELKTTLNKRKVTLALVAAKAPVRDKLRACQFSADCARIYHYFSIQDALDDVDHSDAELTAELSLLRREDYTSVDSEITSNPLHHLDGNAASAGTNSTSSPTGMPKKGTTSAAERGSGTKKLSAVVAAVSVPVRRAAQKFLAPGDAFSPLDDADIEMQAVPNRTGENVIYSRLGSDTASNADAASSGDDVSNPIALAADRNT